MSQRKPAEPTTNIDIQVLNNLKVEPFLLSDSLQKASNDSSLLHGLKLISLFDLIKLIEWKPKEIQIILSPCLPPDILTYLLYERRREQKKSERKQGEAKDKYIENKVPELYKIRDQLKRKKSHLELEILRYKQYFQNNELQVFPQNSKCFPFS